MSIRNGVELNQTSGRPTDEVVGALALEIDEPSQLPEEWHTYVGQQTLRAAQLPLARRRVDSYLTGSLSTVNLPGQTGAEGASSTDDLVRLYLDEIGSTEVLKKEEQRELGKIIWRAKEAASYLKDVEKAGVSLPSSDERLLRKVIEDGEAASEYFVRANLKLVVSIARRYSSSGVSLLDLIQEGNLGLMHAVEKFDYRKGFKFSTYATWWIRQAVLRTVERADSPITVPEKVNDLSIQINKTQKFWESAVGRTPNRAELAGALEVTEAEIEEALLAAQGLRSLNEPVGHERQDELGENIEDKTSKPVDQEAIAGLLPETVRHGLSCLGDDEISIIELRYLREVPYTQQEIAEEKGIPTNRVAKIERTALQKLRQDRKFQQLSDF